MCARATLKKARLAELAEELEAEVSPEDAALNRPRYHIAPSDVAWIIEDRGAGRALRPAIWGYLGRGGRPLVNVRGEQVGSGSGFRDAFAARRCAFVTDGFYEWNVAHRPTWFHRADDGLVLLGALAQPARPGTDAHPRFTVLTTRPNRLVASVHDRMAVVIEAAALGDWIGGDPAAAAGLIAPAPEDALVATPVSTRVNNVRHDDPACLLPDPPASERQQSLF